MANCIDFDDYHDIVQLLKGYFKDTDKIDLWMNVDNPLLGNVKPIDMILVGRTEKLKKFIRSRLDETF